MKLDDVYEFILKVFCAAIILIIATVSLFAFQNMSKKDQDFILIMMMMGQPQ